MEALRLIKAILQDDAGVMSRMVGGIHVNMAPEFAKLPNIIMMSVGGGGDELTHSGPNGLLVERIRIWARAQTIDAAIDLAVAVDKALHGYSGTVQGAFINQIAKVFSDAGYLESVSIQQAIIDVRVQWNRKP